MLSLMALAAANTEVHIQGILVNPQTHRAIEVEIVLERASSAPFPMPRNVNPFRAAVARTMANCQEEAFAYCKAQPSLPICPKKLGLCLASHQTVLSKQCRASVEGYRCRNCQRIDPRNETWRHMFPLLHEKGT